MGFTTCRENYKNNQNNQLWNLHLAWNGLQCNGVYIKDSLVQPTPLEQNNYCKINKYLMLLIVVWLLCSEYKVKM